MKKFMIIALMIGLGTGAWAQDRLTVIPKARFEYVTSSGGHTMTVDGLVRGERYEETRYNGDVTTYNYLDVEEAPMINLGRWEAALGIEFGYKGVGLLFDTDIYMGSNFNGAKKTAFSPSQANFTVKLQYQNPNLVKGLKVFISHTCYHPVKSGGVVPEPIKLVGYHGGVTKIGISYNY